MQVRAIRRHNAQTQCWTGVVSANGDEGMTVELDDGTALAAVRAVSCLVEPSVGDRVLVCRAEQQATYVLAVLERRDAAAPVRVVAQTGVQLDAPSFSVDAENIHLTSRATTKLSARDLQLTAGEVQVVFQQLLAAGQNIVARSDTLRAVSRHANTLFERLHSRLGRSYKVVSELEHVSAQQLNYQVSGALNMHSQNSVITSEGLLKFDGKLMQLG